MKSLLNMQQMLCVILLSHSSGFIKQFKELAAHILCVTTSHKSLVIPGYVTHRCEFSVMRVSIAEDIRRRKAKRVGSKPAAAAGLGPGFFATSVFLEITLRCPESVQVLTCGVL